MQPKHMKSLAEKAQSKALSAHSMWMHVDFKWPQWEWEEKIVLDEQLMRDKVEKANQKYKSLVWKSSGKSLYMSVRIEQDSKKNETPHKNKTYEKNGRAKQLHKSSFKKCMHCECDFKYSGQRVYWQ